MHCHDGDTAWPIPCAAPDPTDTAPRPVRWARLRYRLEHGVQPERWVQLCAVHLHARLDAADEGLVLEPSDLLLIT